MSDEQNQLLTQPPAPETIPYYCPVCGDRLVDKFDDEWGMRCWVCPSGDYKEPI